ncbi:MAG TPA: hypothetical protein VFY05_05855 [Candidatus Angelobacter sp.]|nr:hypothetical protein [Candidatus Angelobacter sp.]
MKRLFLCAFAIAAMALTVSTACAADVTGNWNAEMSTPDGNSFQLAFTFKQEGEKLTGTVQVPQGDAMDISNGKAEGNKIFFDVSFNGTTIHHEGTVNDAGDQIEMTTKSDSGDFPGGKMTLKRATPSSVPAAQSQ